MLAILNLRRLASDVQNLGPRPTLGQIAFGPVHTGLYLCFVAIPVFIYIGRPPARARDGRILAGVTAFTGTFMLSLLPILRDRGPSLVALPEWLHVLAHLLLLASVTLAVWSIASLRMNFSITPEARQLQRGGPYRFVRHPVYVAEIAAAISVVFGVDVTLWPIAILAAFIGVQVGRSVLEERLLSRNFVEYASYARSTPRFVPKPRTVPETG